MNLPVPQFQAVQEPEAFLKFLKLFPHRFDFIYAEHPDPSDRPEWKTEDRHPLSDRLLQEGAYLYGGLATIRVKVSHFIKMKSVR